MAGAVDVREADLLAAGAVDDPHPLFAELRDAAPIVYSTRHRAWLVSRHDDVTQALRDGRISSDRIRPSLERLSPAERERVGTTLEVLARWLVFMDPPDHTRLRRLVHKAFTPRRVQRLRDRISAITHGLLDQLETRGEADLLDAFAYPLPATVIAEMLGAPTGDRDRFKAWSDDISGVVFGDGEPDRHTRAERGMTELVDYLAALAARRTDEPGEDLVTALLRAEEERDVLTRDEVVATCILLLFAGHETTTNLIGNGTWLLLTHPQQRARFEADRDLDGRLVEEVLRYDGPTRAVARVVREAFTWHGCELEVGNRVLLLTAGANRDPARYPDPQRFDLDRDPRRTHRLRHGHPLLPGRPARPPRGGDRAAGGLRPPARSGAGDGPRELAPAGPVAGAAASARAMGPADEEGAGMKLGVMTGYWSSGPPEGAAEMATLADELGLDSIWTAEAYGSDALTPLAWWGARTERVRLGTAIMQMSARTPTAAAMAALTLDHLSGGRVVLGLGVSGPQVVEGWYGQPYPRPLARTREYIDVVRQVFARQAPVTIDGDFFQLPLDGGMGLARR